MRSLHELLGWWAVAIDGVVGVWGLALAWKQRQPSRWFWAGVGVATVMTLAQVVLGVVMIASAEYVAGDQHVFYGLVIAFAFGFAYIYRAQLAIRPALSYGVFFLFVMGLALRAITTLGLDF